MQKKSKTPRQLRGRYWYDHEEFSEWVHTLGGIETVADRLGLTASTMERYCTGQARIPKSVYSFLEVLCTGRLALVMGKEWGDVRLTPAGLQLPGWRRPFTPAELHSLFVMVNSGRMTDNRLRIANNDLEDARQAADEWERKARFYREQLVLESKLGMMLSRVTDQ